MTRHFSFAGTIISILFLIFISNLPAQPSPIPFDHITTLDGLVQSSVTTLLQDKNGFMWIGTQNGLHKYDGRQFKVYKNDPFREGSLTYNWIQYLFQDSQQRIWVGTHSGGVFLLDSGSDRFRQFAHDPADPGSLLNNRVWTIFEDSRGSIWIGSTGGLDRYDPASDSFIHFNHDPKDPTSLSNNAVDAILEDAQGYLWIGTFGGGLNRFDPATGRFRSYRHKSGDPNSLSHDLVKCLILDPDGVLWIGTWGGGLNCFDPSTEKFRHFQFRENNPNSPGDNIIMCLTRDRHGRLWIGTHSGGVTQFDPAKNRFIRYQHDPQNPQSLSDNWVSAVLEDQSGLIWIGSGIGINILNPRHAAFRLYRHNPSNPASLNSNIINTIHEDRNGTLWVGTWDSGAEQFSPDTEKFHHFPANPGGLSNKTVWAIEQDHQGIIWIGTSHGLNRYNPDNRQFTHYLYSADNPDGINHNNISCILEDSDQQLWIGTWGQGLNYFDREQNKFYHFKATASDSGSISGNFITTIFQDSRGLLWIGTASGGLNKMTVRFTEDRRPVARFTHYKYNPARMDGICHNHIKSICEDATGNLWIGTNGGGLSRFDPAAEKFISYSEDDGLPSNVIQCILKDQQNYLWISTNNGIAKIIPDSLNPKVVKFDLSNFLQTSEFNSGSCLSRDGEIYFGGFNGLIRFHPDSVRLSDFAPPVVLTDFKIFNRHSSRYPHASGLQEIELNYRQNGFSFEFAALDYSRPEKNLYSYKLEGFDSDWIFAGSSNTATYTNVNPGSYVFKVRGSNSDGIWSPAFTEVHITITPPFWMTTWFKVLISLAIIGILLGGHFYRMHRVKQIQQKLELTVKEKTHELGEANQQLKRTNQDQAQLLRERDKLIDELQDALGKIKTLSGLLPICSSCKKVRDDQGYWRSIEKYISDHSDADFSHGLCPDCAKVLFPDVDKSKLK